MSRRPSLKILQYLAVAIIAILITFATGLVGSPVVERGFPLGWQVGGLCQDLRLLCLHPAYDWLAFGLDVLFYAVIGYGLILGYLRHHAGKLGGLTPTQT